jgi:hypothetical protein
MSSLLDRLSNSNVSLSRQIIRIDFDGCLKEFVFSHHQIKQLFKAKKMDEAMRQNIRCLKDNRSTMRDYFYANASDLSVLKKKKRRMQTMDNNSPQSDVRFKNQNLLIQD